LSHLLTEILSHGIIALPHQHQNAKLMPCAMTSQRNIATARRNMCKVNGAMQKAECEIGVYVSQRSSILTLPVAADDADWKGLLTVVPKLGTDSLCTSIRWPRAFGRRRIPQRSSAKTSGISTLVRALRMGDYIREHGAIMGKYDPDKKIGLMAADGAPDTRFDEPNYVRPRLQGVPSQRRSDHGRATCKIRGDAGNHARKARCSAPTDVVSGIHGKKS
jgi:hypothetical protein